MHRNSSFGPAIVAALFTAVWLLEGGQAVAAEKLRVLLIDGQNNHEWQKTTPLLVKILKDSDRFVADVATAPKQGADMSGFRPKFSNYDVIVSNYNGDRWPKETEAAFVEYLKNGGGFVSFHAANN